MPFKGVPPKVRLVCTSCGSEREVEDRPVGGKPLIDWWRDRGQRCTPCFDQATAPLPGPTATVPLPTGAGHPDTSRKAAEMAAPRAGSQRAQLLDLAYEVGDFGVTAFEASIAIGRSPNQTATRLQELREQGWMAYATDEHGNRLERATTPGSTGLVQVLTPGGRERWEPTGYQGLAEGAPDEAGSETRVRKPRPARAGGETGAAMKKLKKAGLLDGAVEISPGLAERLLRLQAQGQPCPG